MDLLIITFEDAMSKLGISAIYWFIGLIIGLICICILQLSFNFIKYLFYNRKR